MRPTHELLVLCCPSAALRVHMCAVSPATSLLFARVPARCVVLRVRCPGPLGSCSRVCLLGAAFACAVSWTTWLLFTDLLPRVLCCVYAVLGHLAPLHQPARSVRCFACVVSSATWLPFSRAPAWCVALIVRCPGPLGSCSPVCSLGVLCCMCGVLGHLDLVHPCTRSVCCVACVVSWATWLLFTGVRAPSLALLVCCPGPLGSCSAVCPLRVLCCVCGVLGHLAPVHQCARLVRCFACVVSWATWLLFTGVLARSVVLCVRCPGPLGSCSPVCPLGVLCCVHSVLGPLAPVHR